MKIILRVSVQQSRWMIKFVPFVNWDIREKTSCYDIIETNTINKSLHLSSNSSHIPQSSSSSSSSSSHTHRVMKKKNPIIFWKPIIRFCFGFRTDTTPIISCHGCIHLPVWSRDLQAVANPSLSVDSYTISNTWWPQYQIASCGVMENTRLYTEP